MNRIKTKGINYYIFASVMIHSVLFLLFNEEKDLTLGKKLTPIEIVDNNLDTGYGEATTRTEELIKRATIKKELKKEKLIRKTTDQQKSFEKDKIIKKINNKKFKKNKVKKNEINQPIFKEKKGSGSRDGIKNNEPEKGSLKGKGTIKVTCLKCVRPVYPPIALRRGAEGTPKVKVWINKNGLVYKAELISFSGNESIDRAARKAAFNSTFYPLEEKTSINIEYDLKIK